MTMYKIATLSANSATTLTFSSIPQGYTDLYFAINMVGSLITCSIPTVVKFNSTAATTTTTWYYQSSTSTYVLNTTAQTRITGSAPGASSVTAVDYYVHDYTTSTYKIATTHYSFPTVNSGTPSWVMGTGSAGFNTSAVTSVTFDLTSGPWTFSSGTITLYGILKGTSGGVTVA